MKLKRRRVAAVLLAVAAILVADILVTFLWLLRAKSLCADDGTGHADVGVVFFSDFGEHSGLDAESLRRIDHGIALLEGGRVSSLLCVGGARTWRGDFGAELMRSYCIDRGVPPGGVYSERESTDTWSNWRAASAICSERGWTNIVVISSLAHMPRILRIAGQYGMYPDASPYAYDGGMPRAGLVTIWRQIHHEWISNVLHFVLSERAYGRLVLFVRKWRLA